MPPLILDFPLPTDFIPYHKNCKEKISGADHRSAPESTSDFSTYHTKIKAVIHILFLFSSPYNNDHDRCRGCKHHEQDRQHICFVSCLRNAYLRRIRIVRFSRVWCIRLIASRRCTRIRIFRRRLFRLHCVQRPCDRPAVRIINRMISRTSIYIIQTGRYNIRNDNICRRILCIFIGNGVGKDFSYLCFCY